MSARIVFRPLDRWTDPVSDQISHPFSANWTGTVNLLCREVEQLQRNVRYAEVDVILQVQAAESSMRRDGGIKADAKVYGSGIVVSFESKHGPLRYACDRFADANWRKGLTGWQANVRAVALSLEALRKVDRYGAAASGQQYQGWAALGTGDGATTIETAKALLRHWKDKDSLDTASINDWQGMWRRGSKATHPDHGGDREIFDQVQAAYKLVTAP